MGTNYYLYHPEHGKLHIGKSSGGWCFALHVIPKLGLDSLAAWKPLIEEHLVKDSYEDVVSPQEMLSIISERSWERPRNAPTYYHHGAEPGPNGLIRHSIGRDCVGHGEGPWDLIIGDFS